MANMYATQWYSWWKQCVYLSILSLSYFRRAFLNISFILSERFLIQRVVLAVTWIILNCKIEQRTHHHFKDIRCKYSTYSCHEALFETKCVLDCICSIRLMPWVMTDLPYIKGDLALAFDFVFFESVFDCDGLSIHCLQQIVTDTIQHIHSSSI